MENDFFFAQIGPDFKLNCCTVELKQVDGSINLLLFSLFHLSASSLMTPCLLTGEMVRQARVLAQATSDLVNAMRSDAEAEVDVENSKKLLAAAKLLADATARMVEAAKVSVVGDLRPLHFLLTLHLYLNFCQLNTGCLLNWGALRSCVILVIDSRIIFKRFIFLSHMLGVLKPLEDSDSKEE